MTSPTLQNDPFCAGLTEFLGRSGLLPPAARVLVGVSGGVDSVVLLRVLLELAERPQFRWHLRVVHLDHRLREGSQQDAVFVQELAAQWGVDCIVEQCDVAALADRLGEGAEQAARQARYDVFRRVGEQVNATHLALAHHLDDQAETVLFRILRGTGLRGLAGMPRSRPLGACNMTLVRPLLDCRREEMEQFARRVGLSWRTDPTNVDSTYRRNAIRHELLPLAREHINPLAEEALVRLAAQASEVHGLLASQADTLLRKATIRTGGEGLDLSAGRLASADPVLRQQALFQALEQLGVPQRDLSAEHLRQLADLAGQRDGAVNLPGGYLARRRGQKLLLRIPGAGT